MKLMILLCAWFLTGVAYAADEDATVIVERALQAHGGIEAPAIALSLAGTFDLGTRLQGRTLASEPTPIRERITVDFAGDRLAYELRWHNYSYSVQDLRELYDAQGRVLFLDLRNRNGGWMPGALVPDAAARYRRYVPQALLGEALKTEKLAHRGTIGPAGTQVHSVAFDTVAGESITLYIDTDTHLLRGASAMIDMPLLGDTELMWTWHEHERRGDLVLPRGLQVWLGDKLLKDVLIAWDREPGTNAFAIPHDIAVGPAPEPQRIADSFVPPSQRPPQVEPIGDGVWLVRSLRPGFHMMFVEFDDFVVAVDAPTGWYEMQQIPPMNWSHGDTSSALSEKYLRAIEQAVPGKPVRHVVLTHHHSDHIGGVRAFLAAGATVIATGPAAALALRAARSTFSIGLDRWSGREHERPVFELVTGTHEIRDANTRLRLIELPPGNPKADGFLVVHLPDHDIVYTTGFIYPVPENGFPPVESIDLAAWFVGWLDDTGLDAAQHYNVHGLGKVEPWHMERLRELATDREFPWQ